MMFYETQHFFKIVWAYGYLGRDQGLTFSWVFPVFEFEEHESHVIESWDLLRFGFRFQYWSLVDLFT